MSGPSRLLRRAVLLACGLAAILLLTDLLSAQGRRNPRRLATEFVDGHEVVAGEVLLRFRDARRADFDQANAEVDADADDVEMVGRRGLRRMHSRRHGTRALLAMLRANPEVELVEPNYVIRVDAVPNDPSFNNLWGLLNFGQVIGGAAGITAVDIGATLAWDTTTGSRANVVGVVDTGIDYTHPDLAANIWSAPAPFTVTIGGSAITCAAGTHGFNAITNTCNPMDDHNHGTHVAGTIGAVGNNGRGVAGVNWTASMMGLKFLSASGSGSTSNAIKLIDFAIQAKAQFAGSGAANVRVLSNSWGGGGYSQSLKDAIDRANASDMLFVAAAGNSGSNNDVIANYPSNYASANMVAVAATDNRDRLASFSSYGAATVHLGAPGVSILSTTPNNTYAYYNGTSMATPHVSGVAALVLANCSIPTSDLKTALLTSVTVVPALSGVTTTGGRLNASNALRACRPRVQSVSLTSDVASPQGAGTLITWTATPTGGVAPYEYKWMTYDGQSWTLATNWTSSATYAWTPATSGVYSVGVWVRSSGNTADAAEIARSTPFTVVASTRVTTAALAPDRASPQPVGTTITWTAGQAGGLAPFQYKWFTSDGTTWTPATGWTTAATFVWTPSTVLLNAGVRVWIRSAGNGADAPEASATAAYTIATSTRVTSVTLTPDRSSPQPGGSLITWTATPAGGIAPHQYKWMVHDGVSWQFVTGWTTTNTFAWTPTAVGNYLIGVWVRSAGNPADAAEVPRSVSYVIAPPSRVGSVSVVPNLAAPRPLGTSVTWTATPSGGTAPHQYKWWVYDGSSWSALTGWVTSNSLAWTPSAANLAYQIRVWVRSSGNVLDAAEASTAMPFAITAPPVSAVTVSANRAAPQEAGTTITWTAAPTGGVAPYQYKWFLFNGTTWTVASAWSTSPDFVWTPAAANANYSVRGWVRSAGNVDDAPEAAAVSPFAITAPTPVSAVAITANRVSPQPAGTPITLTATPTSGRAPYQYKWAYFDGVTWTSLANWSSPNTLVWTPAQANAGYTVRVSVRSAWNQADAPEAEASMSMTITSTTVTGVSLVPNRSAPQPVGAIVTWTATPAGGLGPHQYKWWVFDGTAWAVQGSWTASSTFAWVAPANGAYAIGVWVKSAGNPADAGDVARSVPYTIGGAAIPRISVVSLSPDRSSPQPPGATITWTAAAAGGTSPYEYKWSVYDGATWSDLSGWTNQNVQTWTPAMANPAFQVRVWARSAGNVVDAPEASNQAAFGIGAPSPRVTAVTLTPNRASGQSAGTTITWTAVPVGGAAPHQYKWWIHDGVSWTMATGWTTTNTLIWTPTVPGNYVVGVWVKSAGNPADAAEVPHSAGFVIQ